jgi:endonuclease/exonuclease/phosphatase family metal-dependent hydrolase
VLTYNLFWWNLFQQRGGNGGSAGRLIAGASSPAFDFIGFQEMAGDVNRPLGDAGLSNSHGTLTGPRELAIAYQRSWTLLSQGRSYVGEDSRAQYYGKRGVIWGRFRRGGVTAFVVNFHGPLPVGSGGAYGSTTTANNILNVIRQSAQSSDAIILVGDFNEGPGGSMITTLGRSLNRLYTGRSFGGVDHMYSSCGRDRLLNSRNLGTGGSDHDALQITIRM